jgi:PAS domain-containing protein
METTFITIHGMLAIRPASFHSLHSDLTPEARILYSSDSIVDILGHTPDEVVNKPCWDFFHPNNIESAKELHVKGVKLDKAAVLAYCYLSHRDGHWVNCECCFTCVYNVMVVCTSVYQPGLGSQSMQPHGKQLDFADIVHRTCYRGSHRPPFVHVVATRPSIPHAVSLVNQVPARRHA